MTGLSFSPSDLRLVEPRFDRIEESPIQTSDNSGIVAWHANAMAAGAHLCLGSGLSPERVTARRIAIAETAERACFRMLRQSPDKEKFALDTYPTTCGFAAGFEPENTRLRSICEAVERWARALWIDEGFALSEVTRTSQESKKLETFFLSVFQESRLFAGCFSVQDPIKKVEIPLKMAVVVGLTPDGAFSGARVCADHPKEDPWEHACLEAWRHFLIFKNQSLPELPENHYLHRIPYFGTHRREALQQIERAKSFDWPKPIIEFHRSHDAIPQKLVVWRSLCEGFLGYHEGEIQRFVY